MWSFVAKEDSTKSGNSKATCKCCGQVKTQNPHAWWEHLNNKCSGSQDEGLLETGKVEAHQYFSKLQQLQAKASGAKTQSSISAHVVTTAAQRISDADAAVARFIYANGLANRITEDYFLRDMLEKVAAAGLARKPVSLKRVRGPLLQDERQRLEQEQQLLMNIKKPLFGRTLVSDGWTDSNGVPWVNIISVMPGAEAFLKAIDTSGNKKSMPYLAEQLGKYVDSDTDFVIMDGACAGAVELLVAQFAQLSGTICATHGLDLLMRDLGQMDFAAQPLADARKLVQFVKNHHKTRAMFAALSPVVLLAPANTRFGYNYVMVERLIRCKADVRKLFASAEFHDWRKDQNKDTRALGK